MTSLDLFADPIALSAALVDIESPSHHEEAIADAVEEPNASFIVPSVFDPAVAKAVAAAVRGAARVLKA